MLATRTKATGSNQVDEEQLVVFLNNVEAEPTIIPQLDGSKF